VAAQLQGQVCDGITWARRRKTKFRRSASAIRILSLVLAVASTIIFSLQQLNFLTGLAFSFVAVGTLVSAVEPFFNWRSRWILMEEAPYRLQRIRDELEYYLLKTRSPTLPLTILIFSSSACKASGPTPANAGWPTGVAAKLDQNDPAGLRQLGPHVVRSRQMRTFAPRAPMHKYTVGGSLVRWPVTATARRPTTRSAG
jgi:hypothetical protein